MTISPKEYRQQVCRKEHAVNTANSESMFVRDSFLLMTLKRKYHKHPYYKRQFTRLRTGEQDSLVFALESHKNFDAVDTLGGLQSSYDYGLAMAKLCDAVVTKNNLSLQLFCEELQSQVQE